MRKKGGGIENIERVDAAQTRKGKRIPGLNQCGMEGIQISPLKPKTGLYKERKSLGMAGG